MNRKRITSKAACMLCLISFAISGMAADPNPVLIKGPYVSVTKADLTAELDKIPANDRPEFMLDVKRVTSVLEQLYYIKELARQADELKLDQDPHVQDKLRLAREKVLSQERIDAMERALKIPDFTEKARELFLSDKQKYLIPARAKASHILISWKPIDSKSAQENKAAALKKVQEIRAAVISGAKTFEAAAQEFTEDPSGKDNKGDLGWFEASRVVKPFADAVFAMKPGEISQPIETTFGYHIVRLTELTPSKKQTFDEVKQGIMDGLKADYIQTARTQLLREVKGDKRVAANTEEIIKLNPRNNLAPDQPGMPKTGKQ